MAPVQAKAVHDPHCFWFLTEVTTPWSTHEKLSLNSWLAYLTLNFFKLSSENFESISSLGTAGKPENMKLKSGKFFQSTKLSRGFPKTSENWQKK